MTTRLGDQAESDIENADEQVSVAVGGNFGNVGNIESSIVLTTFPNPAMPDIQSGTGAALPTSSAGPRISAESASCETVIPHQVVDVKLVKLEPPKKPKIYIPPGARKQVLAFQSKYCLVMSLPRHSMEVILAPGACSERS